MVVEDSSSEKDKGFVVDTSSAYIHSNPFNTLPANVPSMVFVTFQNQSDPVHVVSWRLTFDAYRGYLPFLLRDGDSFRMIVLFYPLFNMHTSGLDGFKGCSKI
jgi:hypothetical protein